MEKELSIQLWSVRECMKDAASVAETFKALASFGFTGVQTAGFVGGLDSFAASAKEAGLRVVGTHMELSELADTEKAVQIHRTLGTDHAGIANMPGLWQPGGFTKENVYKFIDDANRVVADLAKNGLYFTYHHHAMEFAKIGNDVVLDLIAREIDPKHASIVMDTYWVQHGGAAILEWIERLAGRIDIIHLKDGGVPFGKNDFTVTELGAGNINFPEVIRAAKACGVKEFCYEQDGNPVADPLSSAKQSAEYYFSLVN